jgi:hypothetical protein
MLRSMRPWPGSASRGDTHEVTFAKPKVQVSLLMKADGKIVGMGYQPL